jgi:hypothetical protein
MAKCNQHGITVIGWRLSVLKSLALRLWATPIFRSDFGTRLMLWPQKESVERKVAHRDWPPGKLHQPQSWFQLGDSPNETKFSPSKTILRQPNFAS